MIVLHNQVVIPESEIRVTYSRSPGPGGQNVNKVNSKVTVAWDLTATQVLPPEVLARFRRQQANRINRRGSLIVTSHRHRNQLSNWEDCQNKIRVWVAAAYKPPVTRKKTAPTRGSQARRLDTKRKTSDKKVNRRSVSE